MHTSTRLRAYWQLLRIPYQLQLAPIFGWGYLLSGGRLHDGPQILHFLLVFVCFHVGCFGGLTALNSYYDRDRAPVGGLWNPPSPPPRLKAFAWQVQFFGVLPLFFIDEKLVVLYISIVLLALGYSHPLTRWKGKPVASLVVVALGQGVLCFFAGVFAEPSTGWRVLAHHQWSDILAFGAIGATYMVCAFYPLTQLFQIESDKVRGDLTLAMWAMKRHGRHFLFLWSCVVLQLGAFYNCLALKLQNRIWDCALFLAAAAAIQIYLLMCMRVGNSSAHDDFRRIHFLLRTNAILFGAYLLARLTLNF